MTRFNSCLVTALHHYKLLLYKLLRYNQAHLKCRTVTAVTILLCSGVGGHD